MTEAHRCAQRAYGIVGSDGEARSDHTGDRCAGLTAWRIPSAARSGGIGVAQLPSCLRDGITALSDLEAGADPSGRSDGGWAGQRYVDDSPYEPAQKASARLTDLEILMSGNSQRAKTCLTGQKIRELALMRLGTIRTL